MTTMRQEINLYLPELRPKRDYLTAECCGYGLLGLCALVVLVAALNWLSAGSEDEQLMLVQQRVDQINQTLDAIKARQPKPQGERLDAEIASLRQQLQRRKAIRELIEGRSIGNADGFSGQMQGLASASDGSLYLSTFALTQGGKQVAMQGKTRSASGVPRYVGALKSRQSFSGSQFGQLTIEQDKDSALMVFQMRIGGRDAQ